MKYLIIGGMGFIGSHLIEQLLLLGENNITVVDTGAVVNLNNDFVLPDGIRFFKNINLLVQSTEQFDIVIHLACIPSVDYSNKEPVVAFLNNVGSLVDSLHMAKDVWKPRRFIFSSSAAVYGSVPFSGGDGIKETATCYPNSLYGFHKKLCEEYCLYIADNVPFEVVLLRFFNTFGPRMKLHTAVGGFINNALLGKTIVLHGDGLQSRDFVFVKNVVAGIIKTCQVKNNLTKSIFNICSGESKSIRELLGRIQTKVGRSLYVDYHPRRTGDMDWILGDYSAARTVLGYVPTVSFDSGLDETITWFKNKLQIT